MTSRPLDATLTILFSDIVDSTARVLSGPDGERQMQEHYRWLDDLVDGHAGANARWTGDGIMAGFASTANAVRCAIAMQQAARQHRGDQRVTLRVGLNVGEVSLRADEYFGAPVVIARRLCDSDADGGRILCSSTVAAMLAGRQAFELRDLGPTELKGIAEPVVASEVVYEAEQPAAALATTPFVGRGDELERLDAAPTETVAGRGGPVMPVGEPGIGKTRLAHEFARQATERGARVTPRFCFEHP